MNLRSARIPGEPDPRPDADAPRHVARQSWMTSGQGHGDGDYGIARSVAALLAWRRRRKARKARKAR